MIPLILSFEESTLQIPSCCCSILFKKKISNVVAKEGTGKGWRESLEFLLLLFNCSVMSNSLWPHGLQHDRFPCPSISPWVCSSLCPLELPWWLSWLRIRLKCSRPGFNPWIGKIPWGWKWQQTSVFWSGEFHGLYGPWGRKGPEQLHFYFTPYPLSQWWLSTM